MVSLLPLRMEHPTELTPHPVLGRHALPLLPPTCHGRDNGFHNINKKHNILASSGEGGTPNGTTSLQQPCSPQALTPGCVDAPGSHSRALVQHFTKNIFFKYSSKPKPTFSGVESSNSETICPGLMMWCLPSGIIKIPSGGRWQLKEPANSLPVHCGGSRFLPDRPGNAPDAQNIGTRQASRAGKTWEVGELMLTSGLLPQIYLSRS